MYPLAGIACVHGIFAALAVIDMTRLEVVETFDGLSLKELQKHSGVLLRAAAEH